MQCEMEKDKDREEGMVKRNTIHYRKEETVFQWEEDEVLEDADYISKFIYFEDQQYLKSIVYIFIRA